jgi:hypothetical protein
VNIIAPWTAATDKIDPSVLSVLETNLTKWGYPLADIKSRQPSEGVCIAIGTILEPLLDDKWVYATFRNDVIRQEIHKILPVVYAYTVTQDGPPLTPEARRRCNYLVVNTDSDSLERLFRGQVFGRFLDADEEKKFLFNSGLLVYESIDIGSRRLVDYQGGLAALFKNRTQHYRRLLMTSLSESERGADALLKSLSLNRHIHHGVVQMIKPRSVFIHIDTEDFSVGVED